MKQCHLLLRSQLFLLFVFSAGLIVFAIACRQANLVGKWEKLAGGVCDVSYPAKLEFFDDGTYVGDLPNWNGGKYTIVDGNRIKLDTLTGPGVYEFELNSDRLTFRNDSNCEFHYKIAE